MKKNITNQNIELVRLVTAGSVDDGKSTLIGRLLYDCHAIYEDQLSSIAKASKQRGKDEVDLALLTDGLSAEREQNITIDVAYRYFQIPKRRFIISDVPGHEQYTRNMVTGASNADIALILVDARKGMVIQSKRHLFLATLLGIPHILIVINKMDAASYAEKVFEKIKTDFVNFAARLNIHDLQFIPISALKGDMVVGRGDNMNWYKGYTVFDYLENLQVVSDRNLIDFRFPVQLVVRPHQDFRGYAGKIESGIIRIGDTVVILPSGKKTKISSIMVDGKKRREAFCPQSVILTLKDKIDVSRGDMIVRENNLPDISDNFEASVCWFSEEPLKKNKSYIIKQATKTTRCFVDLLRYKINIKNLHRQETNALVLNEVGRVYFKTNDSLAFDSYSQNKNIGSFIIIDEMTNNTVGAGIIVDKVQKIVPIQEREMIIAPKGAILWFTGLSGSGKSTIADKIFDFLSKKGVECERLDGDIVRKSLTKDLGFSKEDRDKNIERASFVAGLLSRHKVIVLATFISPYRKHRELARKQAENFIEIFVDAPLDICEKRDPKGMYKKARAGKIEFFTGIDDVYEKPKRPDIELKTDKMSLDQCVEVILNYLHEKGFLI